MIFENTTRTSYVNIVNTMDIKERLDELLASNVVLAAFLTALGYLVAYIFIFGSYSFYKIPAEFITISANTLILSISISVGVGFVLYVYMLIYYGYDKKNRGTKKIAVFRTLISVAVILLVLLAFDGLHLRFLLLLTSAILIVSGIMITIFSIKERGIGAGVKRFIRGIKDSDGEANPDLDITPIRLVIYIVVAVIVGIFAYIIGNTMARGQVNYTQISQEGSVHKLVITKNDEELIIKNYDDKSRKFEEGFELQSTRDYKSFKRFTIDN